MLCPPSSQHEELLGVKSLDTSWEKSAPMKSDDLRQHRMEQLKQLELIIFSNSACKLTGLVNISLSFHSSIKKKKLFACEGGHSAAQAAQKGCGSPSLEICAS